MKVLIVKMSSLGDVIHTLAAVNDLAKAKPEIELHWLVEESFQDIPALHPAVKKVIPIAFRAKRKKPIKAWLEGYWQGVIKTLRKESYDFVIDAQGLIKSAIISKLAKGTVIGLDQHSAREYMASWFYQKKIRVPKGEHAVTRLRVLFSKAFQYTLSDEINYGIPKDTHQIENKILFLHGTTWESKHWPDEYWCILAKKVEEEGFQVVLPWGNESEHARAKMIAAGIANAMVLPKLTLTKLIPVMQTCQAAVAVDTGLGHLAAALDIPCVSIYGATNPDLTGTKGKNQTHLKPNFPCSPCLNRVCTYQGASIVKPACYEQFAPNLIWDTLAKVVVR